MGLIIIKENIDDDEKKRFRRLKKNICSMLISIAAF